MSGDYWGHETDEDYPDGDECCASGSCEVCRGAQGLTRMIAALRTGRCR